MRRVYKKKNEKIFIGISGFSYPDWYSKNGLYCSIKKKGTLSFYSKKFNFVEINSSFYREPSIETLKRWKSAVPKHFKFALKVNRFFTHMKRLNVDEQFKKRWEIFWKKCKLLKPKLGPLLFQLPILKFTILGKHSMVNRLEKLHKILPKNQLVVLECRDKSWDCEEVRKIFKKYNWCFCIIHTNNKENWAGNIESGFFPVIRELWFTAKWGTYVRFHGSKGQYKGEYDKKILEKLFQSILEYRSQGKPFFIAFNNTDEKQGFSALSSAFLSQQILLS